MTTATPAGRLSRVTPPTDVTRTVRTLGWINLIVNIVIVVTGGAVRLTASGLGCPTWPTCTGSSLVTTPEMGIHGLVEFTNRLLTFLLVVVALATFVSVWRLRRSRPALFWLALAVGLGIPLQAVIGGVSVLVKLNPYVVGLHFVVSAGLISLCAVFVALSFDGTAEGRVPPRMAGIIWVMALFQGITVLLGIVTTGSGPHAGDAAAPRNGLDSELLQHLHSFPAYAALGLGVLCAVIAWFMHRRTLFAVLVAMLATNAIQIGVGIAQSRLGLPVALVALHMFLACVIVALVSAGVTTMRDPRRVAG